MQPYLMEREGIPDFRCHEIRARRLDQNRREHDGAPGKMREERRSGGEKNLIL